MPVLLRLFGLLGLLLPIIFITIAAGVIASLSAIGVTVLGGHGLLVVLNMDSPLTLPRVFLWVFALGFLRSLLHYLEQYSGHYIAFRLLADIRDLVFSKLRRLCPAKLEVKDKGNLISIITSDIELLEVFYAHTIAPIAIAALTSLTVVYFLARVSLAIAVVATIAFLCVGVVVPHVRSRLGRAETRQLRDEVGDVTSFLLDSLRGLRETIQYNGGKDRLNEMNGKLECLSQRSLRLKIQDGFGRGLTHGVILAFSLVGVLAGIATDLTFSNLLIASITLISSFGPISALSELSSNLNQTIASAERVLGILDEEPQVEEVLEGEIARNPEIECKALNFNYSGDPVLTDINLKITDGSLVGISGRSGSGKSTLLKLFMRFWDSQKGSLFVSGLDISEINTASLRGLESYLTQEAVLFNDTIEENIRIGSLTATSDEVVAAAKKAAIHDFVTTLPKGYATTVGELGDRLSGGERQRIGLARAFLHDSPVMLLDEPTSNLDSLNEAIILRSVLAERGRKTIVLISHRKSTVAAADALITIESGRSS